MGSQTVIESLVSGSLSSTVTTVIYQPLELLKTRIQLDGAYSKPNRLLGRTTLSATELVRDKGVLSLWRGTSASLLRSVPGVGLYYSSLNVLQASLSEQDCKPDSASQAFCFGFVARSMVSFLLLPVTVVKVRYESGRYNYPSLLIALKAAYASTGWVGAAPTILRDSLFSGTYYMSYTKLKFYFLQPNHNIKPVPEGPSHWLNFTCGIVSGLIASLITNPLDVIKTVIQVESSGPKTMKETATELLRDKRGYMRFFDGLVPRGLRRTLISATTWTFYELIMYSIK